MSAKHMLQEGDCGHMDFIRMVLSYYIKNTGRQEDKNTMTFHVLDNADLWLKHLLRLRVKTGGQVLIITQKTWDHSN